MWQPTTHWGRAFVDSFAFGSESSCISLTNSSVVHWLPRPMRVLRLGLARVSHVPSRDIS